MAKTVLIIDDDDDDRALFFDAVMEIDPTIGCLSAKNGQEALQFLKNESTTLPDYIFLDLNMPRLDGIQCLTEIKKIPKLIGIPVIIYSTTKRLEDIETTQRLGAAYFVTKPTIFNEICEAIIFVLNHKWEKNTTVPYQLL